VALIAAALGVSVIACNTVKRPAAKATPGPPGATLWEAPTAASAQDLIYGPWGRERAPDPGDTFTFVERKHSGVNPGMTVTDSRGREWSVKQPYPGGMDSEAPVEVVVSRLLSAMGYHQPPVYYLSTFTLKDDWGTRIETGGRFRLKERSLKDKGPWRWEENPFIGTRPYEGLLVFMMMINNTDMKNSNNTLYEFTRAGRVEQWYVPRDVGAAFGDTHREPRKNHLPSFIRHPFVIGVNNGYVDFAYSGHYKNLVRDRIRPEDVVWTSNLLARLSDGQWNDAFRAGGYDPETARGFIRTLREKIEQGRSLARTRSDRGQ
jgi:hypothetical protein